MVTKGLNKITQNETQDLQLVDNFCKSWANKELNQSNIECKRRSLWSAFFSYLEN